MGASVSTTCSTTSPTVLRSAGVKECEARWYNAPSEDPRCYELQKQLSDAVEAGDVPKTKEAIERGANVNGGYYQSLPVLEDAASDGSDDEVRFLITAGAQINQVRPFGQTALKKAVFYKHKGTVKILLEKGADVCENTEGTALKYAIDSGDPELADLLLVKAVANDCQ